jgi:hypothetical protein
MSQRSQVARIGEYSLHQAALVLTLLSVCMPLRAGEAVPSNEELERSHAYLGNITHVDLATPLERTSGVKGIQFLVQTQQGF